MYGAGIKVCSRTLRTPSTRRSDCRTAVCSYQRAVSCDILSNFLRECSRTFLEEVSQLNPLSHHNRELSIKKTFLLKLVFSSFLGSQTAVKEFARLLIPTVGIVDSDADPRLITYPVPGNDDTAESIVYYLGLFKEAILRGKARRKLESIDVHSAPEV